MILHGIIDIDNCMPKMSAIERINVKKIETKVLNGRKINVKVILEIEVKIYSNDNMNIVSNINNMNDIQMLSNQRKISSLLGMASTVVSAKDTINVNEEDELAEIMDVSAKIINKDNKISYNKILAKADLSLTIIYLTEANMIKTTSCIIPIMGFIDMENISEENICNLEYSIKNLIIKPNNMDSHSIYIEALIGIECSCYEEKAINLIEDLYSISQDLNYKQIDVKAMSNMCNIKDICSVNDTTKIPELENKRILNVRTFPIILNETIRNGKVIYEGEINLEYLFESQNGVEAKNMSIPFNFEIISENIDINSNLNTIVDVISDDFMIDGQNVDINIKLQFNLTATQNENLSIIDEIETIESRDKCIYSMVIYFVKPGDTLWKIAKKFKSTVEDIASVNNIEDVDKLKIGQQLYIPKFVKKQVAV